MSTYEQVIVYFGIPSRPSTRRSARQAGRMRRKILKVFESVDQQWIGACGKNKPLLAVIRLRPGDSPVLPNIPMRRAVANMLHY